MRARRVYQRDRLARPSRLVSTNAYDRPANNHPEAAGREHRAGCVTNQPRNSLVSGGSTAQVSVTTIRPLSTAVQASNGQIGDVRAEQVEDEGDYRCRSCSIRPRTRWRHPRPRGCTGSASGTAADRRCAPLSGSATAGAVCRYSHAYATAPYHVRAYVRQAFWRPSVPHGVCWKGIPTWERGPDYRQRINGHKFDPRYRRPLSRERGGDLMRGPRGTVRG
jgi:hypothetical protein